MATSSGAYIQMLALVVLCGVLAAVHAQTEEDERRPYKFGFTIENMQHRQEEKDERGIIMGEYGFITADGWYLTTIYATDEEGRFKILGRKRERVGPPLDDFSPKVTVQNQFDSSPQVTTSRPPLSSTLSPTRNPISISSPRPFQTITPTTYRPTTNRPSSPSSPFVQTTASFQPPRQSGAFQGIPGCSSCIIPTTTSRPVSPDFVASTAGFRPAGGNSGGGQQPGGFGGSGNRPGDFNTDRNPSGPEDFNPNRNPSGPGNFNSDRNPTRRPGNFNSDDNPSRPNNFNSDRNPSRRPGNNYNSDDGPSGPNDDDFDSNTGGGYNRPSSRPTSPRPSGPSRPYASATVNTPSSTSAPFGRPTTRYPSSPFTSSTARPVTTGAYNNQGYNRPSSGPSGFGDSLQGESGLNYKFNYTTDFQGHHETGYKDGSKVGGFFYNGGDGVGQRVTYEANEFGYQPNIINIELSSKETPRQGEDRDAKLKGSEFLWFKR